VFSAPKSKLKVEDSASSAIFIDNVLFAAVRDGVELYTRPFPLI